MTIIKVAEAKLSDKPRTIKVEMTEDEAIIALTCADAVREQYAEQLARPNLRTRRAIKAGRISEKKIRETYYAARALKDKIGAAIVGANANELEAAIRAVREAKNEPGN